MYKYIKNIGSRGDTFVPVSLFLGGFNDENPIRRERRGHGVKVDVVRNDVFLLELFAVSGCLDCQFISVELDGDVFRAVLLHIEG